MSNEIDMYEGMAGYIENDTVKVPPIPAEAHYREIDDSLELEDI